MKDEKERRSKCLRSFSFLVSHFLLLTSLACTQTCVRESQYTAANVYS
jgi:hypothetical protein